MTWVIDKIIEAVTAYWPVVSQNPIPFVVLILLAFLLAFLLSRWFSSQQISNKDSQIELLTSRLDGAESSQGALSQENTELRRRIASTADAELRSERQVLASLRLLLENVSRQNVDQVTQSQREDVSYVPQVERLSSVQSPSQQGRDKTGELIYAHFERNRQSAFSFLDLQATFDSVPLHKLLDNLRFLESRGLVTREFVSGETHYRFKS